MSYELTLLSAPASEPVTTSECKSHLRFDADDEDALIEAWITAAREHVEKELDRQIINATWAMRIDDFPAASRWNPWGVIRLPKPPLQSVSSVVYLDSQGESQTLSSSTYEVQSPSKQQGSIQLNYGQTWPAVYTQPNAVTIRYIAGYGASAADVPQTIKQVILLLVAHFFEHRTASVEKALADIPFGVKALLDAERWGSEF